MTPAREPNKHTSWALIGYAAIAVVMTWPLAARLGREIAWDLGDPVFNAYVMRWTGGQLLAALGGDFNALHQVLARQHLFARASDDCLLGTSDAADAPDAAGLRGHRQHRSLLQPPVSLDVRTFGIRDVSPGSRPDRAAAGSVRRGARVRVRALPHFAVFAPAGALDLLDAARALWLPPLFCDATREAAGRCGRGPDSAESFVRLLPLVLPAVRRRLLPVRNDPAWAGPRRADVDLARRRRARGRRDHLAVRGTVSRGAAQP